MFVDSVAVGPYATNCYVFGTEGASCWVVDPGNDAPFIVSLIKKHGDSPQGILLTHTHWDHVTGIPGLRDAYKDIPIYVSEADRKFLGPGAYVWFERTIADRYFWETYKEALRRLPEPDVIVKDGDAIPGTSFQVIATPGHTPGGVCYYSSSEKILFSGDTLFAGGYGRTDFYGGSEEELKASLRKLLELPSDVSVFPGHGPETFIKREGSLYQYS